ncbi:hypothetical protein A6R68_22329, partial [Neotoma lepida]
PRRGGTKPSIPGAHPQLFVDRPDFFDYPDSDQASLLAVAQFIGEKPVTFVKTGSGPGLFQHILVGALVVAFFLFFFQFCMHELPERGLTSRTGALDSAVCHTSTASSVEK